MISSILLAAGESRRMGEFKQLLPLGDRTFVEHCVDNLLASRVDEVMIVTGHRELEIRNVIGDRPVRFAHNSDYHSGMASSIKCGVASLSATTRAFVLALVDQPQISPEVINLVIETYEQSHAIIVIPTYQGRNGHPILLDTSLQSELLKFDPDQGLRQVVRSHPDRVEHVEVPSGSILEDCDMPEDYERLVKR